jgi:hypothetical protein
MRRRGVHTCLSHVTDQRATQRPNDASVPGQSSRRNTCCYESSAVPQYFAHIVRYASSTARA